jgi:hypothetical protein
MGLDSAFRPTWPLSSARPSQLRRVPTGGASHQSSPRLSVSPWGADDTWARNPDVLLHLETTQRGPSSSPWKSDLPPCKFGLTVASLTDSGVHMVHALLCSLRSLDREPAPCFTEKGEGGVRGRGRRSAPPP